MKTLETVERSESFHIDRRASLAPQLKHWLGIFSLKYRTKPARISWNPGTYRRAEDDPELEFDSSVTKGYVKMVVR